MTNTLSVYYSPHHWYPKDEEYIRRLDPAWVRIHQPTARAIWLVQQAAPNARIMLRSWDIDDHNGERKREMYADPKGAARNHLAMWKVKWDELVTELHRNNWQAHEDRWFLGLVNEPDPAYVPQTVEYTLEAMRLVQGTSIRLGVVCSSVGTFSKPSENNDGWTLCKPLEKPINDGRHILIVHEYWQPEGPSFGEDGGNLAWRHHIIPLDVPILIGESGANGYIYGRYSKDDDSGWQKTVADPKPQTFATQVKEYIAGCDQRVQGVCIYMTDYHDDQWQSFDTQPAMEQLLSVKGARPLVPSPFASKPLPSQPPTPPVKPGEPTPAWVAVPDGANIRSQPKDGKVLIAVPYGEKVAIVGVDEASGWNMVRYRKVIGWMSPMLVSMKPPVTQPPPMPSEPVDGGDKWQRTINFILKEEGGFTANDEGAPANFGINQGANPDLDVKNITREQAIERYRTKYWIGSGADQLDWPFCLLVMDASVQHGQGVAAQMLKQSMGNMWRFQGLRQGFYAQIEQGKWQRNGKAWMARMSRLLLEAAK